MSMSWGLKALGKCLKVTVVQAVDVESLLCQTVLIDHKFLWYRQVKIQVEVSPSQVIAVILEFSPVPSNCRISVRLELGNN